MPESKKISELPAFTTVQPGDILPVVDSLLTQTGSCTAAQVAAIGGGPPGDGTVTTAKMADNAVTAAKCSFTGPDKLFSRVIAGSGAGVEIDCTPYARGLLSAANGPAARAYLDSLQSTDNPIFTGQVQVGRGSAIAPSIAPSADPATGLFFPASESVAFAYNGSEIFRLASDGGVSAKSANDDVLRPRYMAVAWCNFNGQTTAGAVYQIVANQLAVAARYGLSGTIIGNDAATQAYMQTVESARGLTLSFPSSPSFSDSYGKGTFPRFNLGTETRANYTTPGDNFHWRWNGSQWVQTSASGNPWIGTIDLTTAAGTSPIRDARGIVSISRIATGNYTVRFAQALPDTNYCVIASCSENPTVSVGVCRPHSYTTSSVSLVCQNTTNNVGYDPTHIHVAIFR